MDRRDSFFEQDDIFDSDTDLRGGTEELQNGTNNEHASETSSAWSGVETAPAGGSYTPLDTWEESNSPMTPTAPTTPRPWALNPMVGRVQIRPRTPVLLRDPNSSILMQRRAQRSGTGTLTLDGRPQQGNQRYGNGSVGPCIFPQTETSGVSLNVRDYRFVPQPERDTRSWSSVSPTETRRVPTRPLPPPSSREFCLAEPNEEAEPMQVEQEQQGEVVQPEPVCQCQEVQMEEEDENIN
uniref:Uncharacterized protein n=1 Tax=Chromera velia CCMP2878 TaxID=1169474 RepID=A0A0G4IF67_9ALVE|eukprot:Cvel_13958.t1-p1 / transcript=Cvel_13958.t1 / gene=Cvel_13958 / organism=Chromera_velia_CCMP2878 / gene_product=hypothetical protein / transcript_product=hypothetical protein / location=Cvel_scaffold974:55373-56086(-) / protein_length=238 / sequence_SO=supercontig / SO=protein_coding / is_pseudo=false